MQATIILKPGQRGTYAGFQAVVVRHYAGNMYEIRVPGGVTCVSGTLHRSEVNGERNPADPRGFCASLRYPLGGKWNPARLDGAWPTYGSAGD